LRLRVDCLQKMLDKCNALQLLPVKYVVSPLKCSVRTSLRFFSVMKDGHVIQLNLISINVWSTCYCTAISVWSMVSDKKWISDKIASFRFIPTFLFHFCETLQSVVKESEI
jgi:hypothetical protein